MAMISAVELRAVLGADEALQARVDSIHAAASARIQSVFAWRARRGQNRIADFVFGVGLSGDRAIAIRVSRRRSANQRVPRVPVERRTRAVVVLASTARGGVSVVRWPWQRAASSNIAAPTPTQVVTAILQSASGGGVRTALATAAVESCATLYASALSACAITGSAERHAGASCEPGARVWRVELVRRGQCVSM